MDNQNNFNANGWDQNNNPVSAPQGDPTYAPQGAPAPAPQGDPAYAPQGDSAYAPQGNPAYAPQGDPAYAPPGAPSPAPQGGKNKKMIIIIAIAAVVVIAGIVCAIIFLGGDKSDSKKSNDGSTTQVTTEKELTKEEKIVGEWKATMDYTDKCKEALGEEFKDVLGDDFKAEYDINVVFNKDGTYTIQADAASVSALKESLKQSVKNALINYLQQQYSQLSSMTDEQIIKAYESGAGESFDVILDKAIEEMKFDTITKKDFEGQYKVDEEHFYLSAAKDKLVDETEYAVYEMKDDNTIEVKDYILDGKSNDVIFTLPCTLNKVK